jgi:hypothetical protein
MSGSISEVLQLESGECKWWNKPLVRFGGRLIPAELAILSRELHPGEKGVWLNSRGTNSGVADLVSSKKGKYITKRVPLPAFVSALLTRIYSQANVKRGCPDLVIWNSETKRIRLVEVKCPHWDRPSQEQKQFLQAAESSGILAKIVEWEFQGRPG